MSDGARPVRARRPADDFVRASAALAAALLLVRAYEVVLVARVLPADLARVAPRALALVARPRPTRAVARRADGRARPAALVGG